MTIKLLTDWPYALPRSVGFVTMPAGAVVGVFDAATEAGMIAAKLAIASVAGADWFPPSRAGYLTPEQALVSGAGVSVSASLFGIQPGAGVDNTASFAALVAWWRVQTTPVKIVFGPGEYFADFIQFDGFNGYTPQLHLEGTFPTTIFRPRAGSTAPVFFTIIAAYMFGVRIDGIQLWGNGVANQDGFAIVSTPRALDGTGGITWWEWENFQVQGFDGQAVWMRGSQRTGGLFGTRFPNQYGFLRNCFFVSNRRHSFESIGQFGQIAFEGGTYDGGGGTTSAGASVVLALDYRFQTNTPTAANTGTNTFTCAGWLWPHGTPCRVLGAGLPSGLAKSTTYWAWQVGVSGAGAAPGDFRVASSPDNAGTQTAVTLGTTGTLGSYFFVALWATGLAANTFSTGLPHKLCTGDRQRLVGANLPTGAALATDYYVIRVSHTEWRLATTEGNAQAGTAITMTGGTAADYGFVAGDGTVGDLTAAYSVNGNGLSMQTKRMGLYLYGCTDVTWNAHVEALTRSFHVYQSHLNISGGVYQEGAADSGSGVWLTTQDGLTRVSITGKPDFLVPPDKLICNLGGIVAIDPGGAPTTVNSQAWAASNNTTGMAKQIGVGGGGDIDAGFHRQLFVNTSATQITTVNSLHAVQARITLVAWSGSIVLNSGGNILMTGGPLTVAQNASVTLERWDTIGTWVLVGRSF